MKGLAIVTIGLWVVLQTTYGPLATKVGLITGGTATSIPPGNAAGKAAAGDDLPSGGSSAGSGQPVGGSAVQPS